MSDVFRLELSAPATPAPGVRMDVGHYTDGSMYVELNGVQIARHVPGSQEAIAILALADEIRHSVPGGCCAMVVEPPRRKVSALL